jgi:CHAT domain-containing protein
MGCRSAEAANAQKQPRWLGLAIVCGLTLWLHGCAGDQSDAQDAARRETYALLYGAQNDSSRKTADLPRALAQIQRGLGQTRGDPLQYGLWLQPLWLYYLLNDEHARARDTLEEALPYLARGQAAPELIADMTVDLSYSLILLGEVAKAKEYLRQAIVLVSERTHGMLVATLYYNLGDAYRKTGERRVAQRYFEAAYEIFRRVGELSKANSADMKLGSLAREAGNQAVAVQRHERALAQFRRDHSYFELVTQIELARDHAAAGHFELAEQFAQRALDDPRALPEQRIDATVLLLRVMNDRRVVSKAAAADPERARTLVHGIESLLEGSSTRQKSEFARPTHQLQFQEQAIRHYALEGNLEEVERRGRRAIRIVQHVAAGLSDSNDDTRAWLGSAQPVLNEYVKALYKERPREVLPLLEAYYVAPVRTSGVVERALEHQAVARFEHWRTAQQNVINAAAAADRLQAIDDSSDRYRAARRTVEQQLHARDLARDAYLALPARRPDRPVPEVSAGARLQQPAVPSTDVVVRYFVQEQVSFGIVVARGEPRYFDLPPRSQVVKLTRRALEVLENPGDGRVDRAPLSALARLLPPQLFERDRGAKRLIVVADDVMQAVPFAAIDIAVPAQPYRPLAIDVEIVRTKSMRRYYASSTAIAQRASGAAADIVIFANPLTVARLPQLPDSTVEAAAVAKLFEHRVVKAYLGADATRGALLSPEAREARLLHIATHGHFSSAAPDLVGLATSITTVRGQPQQGFVGLADLFAEPFQSRLVVLSGCETTRGMDYSGWGVGSLADGFLTQGAGAVLGMGWSVSDAATAALMSAFYRGLSRSNGNASLALQAAQQEMRASERFSHPFYWAGAVLESTNRHIEQHVL